MGKTGWGEKKTWDKRDREIGGRGRRVRQKENTESRH